MAAKRTCECGSCKTCRQRARMQAWRERNRQRARAAYRRWYAKPESRAHRRRYLLEDRAARPEVYRDRLRQFHEQHPDYYKELRATSPEKMAARDALSAAIRRGKIARQPCEICGGRAQAHHPDYARPLDVVWLCRLHHEEAHRLSLEAVSNTAASAA